MTDHPAAVSPDAPEPRADEWTPPEPGMLPPMPFSEQAIAWLCEPYMFRSDPASMTIGALCDSHEMLRAAAPRPAGPTPEATDIDALLDAFQQAWGDCIETPYPEKYEVLPKFDAARLALRTALASARAALDAIAAKLDVKPDEVVDEVDGLLTVASAEKIARFFAAPAVPLTSGSEGAPRRVSVPKYPGGVVTYRKDSRGWTMSEEDHYRGALATESDDLWLRARFAEALTALASARSALDHGDVT